MEENGIITGKIPCSGSGIHKTYEESIIRVFTNNKLNSYKNIYYMKEDGSICWNESEEEYNDFLKKINEEGHKYKEIEILSVLGFGNNGEIIVEFIEPQVLRKHLIAEAVMRQQKNEEKLDNNTSLSPSRMHRTYPESFFRIIFSSFYKDLLDRSYNGIFIRKSSGKIVFPYSHREWNSRDILQDCVLETEINENDFEEVIILNSYYNDNNNYFVEFINKDVYDLYESNRKKLMLK